MNFALSPLDGRYRQKSAEMAEIFSEFGLMKYRVEVEIEWFVFLGDEKFFSLDPDLAKNLRKKVRNFSEKDFQTIKTFEQKTNHDVKAVEYFLREWVPQSHWQWIHFAATSEDINNAAYSKMLENGRNRVSEFLETQILDRLKKNAHEWKNQPLLARTHGQAATPTTMGKEWAVFWSRLCRANRQLKSIQIPAKFSGASGNFAAHLAAFPDKNWAELSQKFVEKNLNLHWNGLTTQIENHDSSAQMMDEIARASSILIDFAADIWGYISRGYFGQKLNPGETGSSTMPHKVNPIDFENAEGNAKLARGVARTLADHLPISRFQRDLTDSTLQRNFGLVFGHFWVALQSFEKGLGKLELRPEILKSELDQNPEVLTEALQTALRAHGDADAYEKLKAFSRGQKLDLPQIREFIDQQKSLPQSEKSRLKNLTPQNYTGLSAALVDKLVK